MKCRWIRAWIFTVMIIVIIDFHALSKLGKQKLGVWFNLRLHCIWNTIFWQIVMIFVLFVLDFVAWFSHPGLWKIRLKWPFFVIERQIFEKSKTLLYSSASSSWRVVAAAYGCIMSDFDNCFLTFFLSCFVRTRVSSWAIDS